jgi:hypothetical protein
MSTASTALGTALNLFVVVLASIALITAAGPSFWLVVLAGSYAWLRGQGLAEGLGYRAGRQLDLVVLGGLVATQGLYALLCRGVAPSGFAGGLILTILFQRGAQLDRRSWIAWLVVAGMWAAMLYRAAAPASSPLGLFFHTQCLCSSH